MKISTILFFTLALSSSSFASEYFTALSDRGNVHCHEMRNPSNEVWRRGRESYEMEAKNNATKLARSRGYRICEVVSMIVKEVESASGGRICAIEATLLCGN